MEVARSLNAELVGIFALLVGINILVENRLSFEKSTEVVFAATKNEETHFMLF